MNHVQILKRSWEITWRYRALWVLGILLALTTGGGGGNGFNGGSGGGSGSGGGNGRGMENLPEGLRQLFERIADWFQYMISPAMRSTLIAWAVGLTCVLFLLGIVSLIVRYVSFTGIIRMIDRYEASGEKVTWRQGWRMGWSAAARRLFLIDLVVYLPVVLGFIALFGCAVLPVIVSAVANQEPTAAGIISTIGLFLLALFLVFIISLALGLFMELVYRQAALGETGVFDSIRAGWNLARAHLKDVFIMWLIMIGVNIGVGIVFIPIFILALLVALIIGGGAGAGLYFLITAASTAAAGWGWAIFVGLALFILALIIPLTFAGGLFQVYRTSVWTLAWRELVNPLRPAAIAPAPGGDVLPAA